MFAVQCICLGLCGVQSHLFPFWFWTILPLYAFRWLDSTDRPFWQYVHHLLLFCVKQSSSLSNLVLILMKLWICFVKCKFPHNSINQPLFFIFIVPHCGLEWNLMAILCHCSWWQSRFPANVRPMFCQPVRQPQRVHRLQRSTWSAKPRKSNPTFVFLPLNSYISHYIKLKVENRKVKCIKTWF